LVLNDKLPDYGAYEEVFNNIYLGTDGNRNYFFKSLVELVEYFSDNYYEQRIIILIFELFIFAYCLLKGQIKFNIYTLISINSVLIEYMLMRVRSGIVIIVGICAILLIKRFNNLKVYIYLSLLIFSLLIHLSFSVIIFTYIYIYEYSDFKIKKSHIKKLLPIITGVIAAVIICFNNDDGSLINQYRLLTFMVIPCILFLGASAGYKENSLFKFMGWLILTIVMIYMFNEGNIGDGENISRILSALNVLGLFYILFNDTSKYEKLIISIYSIISTVFILKYLF